MLTHVVVSWRELIGVDVKSGIGEEDIYKGKEEKLVLVLLSESYSELDLISISASKLSSSSISHCLLTT